MFLHIYEAIAASCTPKRSEEPTRAQKWKIHWKNCILSQTVVTRRATPSAEGSIQRIVSTDISEGTGGWPRTANAYKAGARVRRGPNQREVPVEAAMIDRPCVIQTEINEPESYGMALQQPNRAQFHGAQFHGQRFPSNKRWMPEKRKAAGTHLGITWKGEGGPGRAADDDNSPTQAVVHNRAWTMTSW